MLQYTQGDELDFESYKMYFEHVINKTVAIALKTIS